MVHMSSDRDPWDGREVALWHMEPAALMLAVAPPQDSDGNPSPISNTATLIAVERLRDARNVRDRGPTAWGEFMAFYQALHACPAAAEILNPWLEKCGIDYRAASWVYHPRLGRGQIVDVLIDGQVKVRFLELKRIQLMWPFALVPDEREHGSSTD